MAKHWADREQMRASLSKTGTWAHYLWFLALIFLILGIVADAANSAIGLEPMSWFMLAIAAFLASVTYFIGWAVSWYLEINAAKKKE